MYIVSLWLIAVNYQKNNDFLPCAVLGFFDYGLEDIRELMAA
jgi:hypothetical protein